MSTSKTEKVSADGRNAYFTVSADNIAESKEKSNDSLHLTAKPLIRARTVSLSPMPTGESLTVPLPKSVPSSALVSYSSLNQINTLDNNNKTKTQVGMDRYITIVKRGRSPKSSRVSSVPKISRDDIAPSNRQNRFAILQNNDKTAIISNHTSKPPPIYVREKNSSDLLKKIISSIGENKFHIIQIKRGDINETKIQIYAESDYRKMVADLEKTKTSFYTYQLKSAKGLQIVIKGIDAYVDSEEVKRELINQGFKVKNAINIVNREKIPQPMFRVELEPNDIILKKNEPHPIYNIKYLLHRKITVEEPHKRSGPVQCHNCQEYGHTKTYCKLPTVCVVCGELHGTASCNKAKEDKSNKKCSNCGGNHTANYRGCPVYSFVKQIMAQKPKITPVQPINTYSATRPQMAQPVTTQVSYADALKINSSTTKKVSPPTDFTNSNSSFNFSRLESTIDNLVQTINNFTTNMTSLMQEMLRMQNTLLHSIVNKP